MGRMNNDRGFVLVLVLVTVALLSASAVALMSQARTSATLADVHSTRIKTRALLDAASARVFHAMVSSDDPMKLGGSDDRRPLRWAFDNDVVEISFENEAGKPDLNRAPTELVLAVARAVELVPQSRQKMADTLSAARRDGRIIPSVASLLDQCARLAGKDRELESYLTVVTAKVGVTVGEMDERVRTFLPSIRTQDLAILREHNKAGTTPLEDPRLAHLHRHLSDDVGLTTVSILATEPDLPPLERRISFGRLLRAPYLFEVRSADRSGARSEICAAF